jgi:hypothetical protein
LWCSNYDNLDTYNQTDIAWGRRIFTYSRVLYRYFDCIGNNTVDRFKWFE